MSNPPTREQLRAVDYDSPQLLLVLAPLDVIQE